MELSISDYNRRYFGDILRNLKASLQLRCHILACALAEIRLPYSDVVFVDYGGGTGLLALLAKELGVGTVIYDDIYDVSCHDARVIAESIDRRAEYYAQGDIDDLIRFVESKSISCHAIASYDVIEHIYNVEAFLRKLIHLSYGQLTIVMSSSANSLNPLINRRLKHIQVTVENRDREAKWGNKLRDCRRAYVKVRKELIHCYLRERGVDLPENEIWELAQRTRGLMEKDIYAAISEYLKTGNLPYRPNHPTNVCDPYTGNWAEHLLDPYALALVLTQSGFRTQVLAGLYGDRGNAFEKLPAQILNSAIRALGQHGLRLAPFYTLYGVRDKCALSL
jgi:SAM-dependent methyltransferase